MFSCAVLVPVVDKNPHADDRDRGLVDRANCGDAEAFELMYMDHRGWVVALARRFTGNNEDALDVMQDTFAYLFGQFPGFKLTSSLRAYLFPVVKHRSISMLRKRRPTVDINLVRDQGIEQAVGLSWQPDVPSEIDKIIARLPVRQRETVYLRFVLDMKLGEIAAALGVPLGTAKSRLHKALKALRSEFKEKEQGK